MKPLSRAAVIALAFFSLSGYAQAQVTASPPGGPPPPGQVPPASPQRQLLRIFLDCQYECDTEYLRQNVAFVDYVRDRAASDVHVLVTTQGTGGGGSAWTLKFIGAGRFQGQDRTLTFTTPQTATEDDRRKEFTRVFKLGVVTYAADSPIAGELEVNWKKPAQEAALKAPTKDPWNYWVFRMNAGGSANGEESSKSRSHRLGFSANRTTAEWKLNFGANLNVDKNTFKIDEGTTIKSRSENWGTDALVVKSLGPHWSIGSRASLSHSSYSNTDLSLTLAPGLEYDLFPYSESARRSLTLKYSLSTSRYKYKELTIYHKLKETVPSHSLDAALSLRQPWGSVYVSSTVSQHLNNTKRYGLGMFGSTDVRLFKGFSFNLFADYSRIRDQISLRKGSAATEEVLLRLQQLATGYRYYVSFGVSYSFGSIFNSVVNPRFGGGGGGMMMMF